MRSFYSDLALEAFARTGGGQSGLTSEETTREGTRQTSVRVLTDEAARRLGRDKGLYMTLENPSLPRMDANERLTFAACLADAIRIVLPKTGCVLAVGLGNRRMTADALGSRVCDRVLVTRHLEALYGTQKTLRPVCCVTPGVLGETGMESADMIAALTQKFQPSCVLAVDALAARNPSRIGTTVQLADSGISPGSGVGNHRHGLNQGALGVPVIALGVPMVVYASAIARDALEGLMGDSDDPAREDELEALCSRVSSSHLGELVVTPRDVDALVSQLSEILALALNIALQPSLRPDEIALLSQ